ncbi:hypothetical protein [Salinarimonas rosea]|uniref:hypothetical protein n=1 Tax=Salinarimonas rosea TaxID=552063 RepID=UPI000404B0F3|nr:hypothetical protein [Salinarimonas rosea]
MSEKDDPHYWAKRRHERFDEDYAEANKATAESGVQAVRAAFLLNGGACIALLTFLGRNAGTETAGDLFWAAVLFSLGAALAAFAAGATYLTNHLYVSAKAEMTRDLTHPFVHETKASKRLVGWGDFFKVVAIICVLASYAGFMAGVWAAYAATVPSA